MKKLVVSMLVLALAGSAFATLGDVSSVGLTGLWRFQSKIEGTNFATMAATFGTDMINSAPGANGYWYNPVWVNIGVPGNGGLYSDGGAAQIRSWDYLTCTHGIAANGGGSYVNEYTIAMDYLQTNGMTAWNSLFQTASGAHDNDGDLWTDSTGRIGVGDMGYSTLTIDRSKWHRIVLSVDNGNFFRVYVDGVLFLDNSTGANAIDGRYSLNSNFHLFADNSWEDQWGQVSTVATWGRALTTAEVADMGGWIGGATMPTGLILLPVPEPATIAILALGGLLLRRKK